MATINLVEGKPAILGGTPIFEKKLPLIRPDIPSFSDVEADIKSIFATGMLTKGQYLKTLECKLAGYLNVNYVVCVSSCTMGLALGYKSLNLQGEVIVPSFTFMATVHPLMWLKDVTPVFVDIDPETFNIDPQKVEEAITPNTTAIVGVHIFGTPANIEQLTTIAKKHNLKLIFDAAHGFGSLYKGKRLGSNGDFEAFSCSPTKLFITGEGGVFTTNNEDLAYQVAIGREYGNPGNYGSNFAGLNGRMAEFNAVLGLKCLENLENIAEKRNQYAALIKKQLTELPGIRFQRVESQDRSSYKDLSILIDPQEFGITRDQLVQALTAENIETRNYYAPPVHKHKTYAQYCELYDKQLPVTNKVCDSITTLPLSSRFTEQEIEQLCLAIVRIHKNSQAIKDSR